MPRPQWVGPWGECENQNISTVLYHFLRKQKQNYQPKIVRYCVVYIIHNLGKKKNNDNKDDIKLEIS